jgi:hypothetical protein
MTNNFFTTVLETRGFVQGSTGSFISPDMKYGDGISVEVTETYATARFRGGMTRYFLNCPSDVKKFLQEVI